MQMNIDRLPNSDDAEMESDVHAPERGLPEVIGLSIDFAERSAAAEVEALVDELESTLDARERRLLHQLRLASESLGAIRASASLTGLKSSVRRSRP